jgi:hypothetical protein
MASEPRSPQTSRREFLSTAAGAAAALSLQGLAVVAQQPAPPGPPPQPFEPVRIPVCEAVLVRLPPLDIHALLIGEPE